MKTFLANLFLLLITLTAGVVEAKTAIEVCGPFAVIQGQPPKIIGSLGPLLSDYNVYLMTQSPQATVQEIQSRVNLIASLKLGQLYCVKGYLEQLPTRALILFPISARSF